MRDRLIELLHDYTFICPQFCNKVMLCNDCKEEQFADYLLENGVIVPPCKVGDIVYRIVKLYGDKTYKIVEGYFFEFSITQEQGEIAKPRFYFWEKGTTSKFINQYSLWCDLDEIGKTVFLTKEEAEQALKERGKE